MNDRPGQRFSQVYLERGQPLPDSQRMRRRLAIEAEARIDNVSRWRLAQFLQRELGIHASEYPINFYPGVELRDVLDAITLTWRYFANTGFQKDWRDAVRRIFAEENVGYTLDDAGGVHLLVDREFQHNLASALSALEPGRFKAAADAFRKAQRALDSHPPDGKTAIREVFEAAETVFKLAFGTARLGSAEAKQFLPPRLGQIYAGNEPAINAANRLVAEFGEWCNAAHQYRHGPAIEEPAPPPLGLAVVLVSAGASYIRWLAEIAF